VKAVLESVEMIKLKFMTAFGTENAVRSDGCTAVGAFVFKLCTTVVTEF